MQFNQENFDRQAANPFYRRFDRHLSEIYRFRETSCMSSFSSISLEPEEIISFLKRDLRLKEIYQEVIYQKIVSRAAQERGLTITPEEMQTELNRMLRDRHFINPSDIAIWLADQMLTWHELEVKIYERLLTKKLARDLFSSEVQELFYQQQSDFEQILLYKITVPYESLAYEISYQIAEEEISFYEAAHLYDVDERRRLHCGYEGKQARYNLNPEIAEMLFNANVGEVIGPLKSPTEIYDLFLVDDFFSAELTNEVYEDLLRQMLKAWLENELNLYILSLE